MVSCSVSASEDCQTRCKHDSARCDNLITMRKLTAYRSIIFASAALAVAGWGYFSFDQPRKWVGRTDLEVTFVVLEAATGQPIPHATIHIRAQPGGFCADPPQREFSITTDKHGHTRQLATSCLCFGSEGRFQDTFGSHLPRWSCHATANGYTATNPTGMDVPENERRVQCGVPFATLSVPIQLRKNAMQ